MTHGRPWSSRGAPRASLWSRSSRDGSLTRMSHPAALAEDDRGIDERKMCERLREVAELPVRDRVVLLGEQTDVAAQVEQPLEQLARLLDLALQREHVREPERTCQEHALARRQPVLD